ncbi:MAG: hypothetical protein CMC88_05665 [Flavobacteriaceae bacterium]|nr:hypothetical protein [Flavobacteriaceae bacterium]|tara:strand:- start:16511 stop:17668 length:1158 start_codon:yes stop_codon:yes gene_type:complete
MRKLVNIIKIIGINLLILSILLIGLEQLSIIRDEQVGNPPMDSRVKGTNLWQKEFDSVKGQYNDSLLFPILPSLFLNKEIIPLGSISKYYTLLGNENGYYPVYKNDRYGFNNMDSIYKKDVDAILIGDSFVQGYSVEQKNTISSKLTKNGLISLNFGSANNSLLTGLASLREYGELNNSKIILWFFFEGNDIPGIPKEFNSKVLRKYYENESFTQNLISRQSEIDSYIQKFKAKSLKRYLYSKIKMLSLYRRFDWHYNRITQKYRTDVNPQEIFYNTILKAKKESIKKNKKFVFVYLPTWYRFYDEENILDNIENDGIKKAVIIKFLKDNNIDYFDFENTINNESFEPREFFGNPGGHYNPFGYDVLSYELYNYLCLLHPSLCQN